RFLRGMIRVLVHRLVEVGTGQSSLEEFSSYLSGEVSPKFLNQAPPEGLYLSGLDYTNLDFPAADKSLHPFNFE
ncbi:MAG: tRNA pseudouridine38-40 synthase, partial [Limisphaerales bacterium]